MRIEFDTAPEPRERETSPAADVSIGLPAGTNLIVRMIDTVDSERDSVGQTFAASLVVATERLGQVTDQVEASGQESG